MLMRQIATLAPDERAAVLSDVTEQEAQELLYDWRVWARPEQLTPPGNWRIWLFLAGRGAGKTRTATEDVKRYGLDHPGSRIAIVAPTYADARDTCIEGDSGMLAILPPHEVDRWNRSLGELILKNGTRYKIFSAEEPDRLRGPQHHRAYCDELASWKYANEAFDMLMFGLRLGDDPRVIITTTPRPIKLIRELVERAERDSHDVYLTRGSTYDNADNLAPTFIAQMTAKYSQTRLGRQELFAAILDDAPGALWKRDAMIEAHRVTEFPPLRRIVVGVDPAASSSEHAAETGIIVAGIAANGHGYVLEDLTLHGSPHEWATAVVAGYYKQRADRIVAEVNHGGEMVEATIRSIDKIVAYKAVHASRGKAIRAEPVSALYERGLIHHVGYFADLEDQLTSWCPGDVSPDRLDALVWAFTELYGIGQEAKMTLPFAQGVATRSSVRR